MHIACSTSIRCGSPLEEALQAVQKTGMKYVDLLAIGAWAHINPHDLHEDWDAAVSGVEQLLEKYQLQPVVMNTGTTVQLHNRSDEAHEIRQQEVRALTRFMNHFGIKTAAIQPLQKDPERAADEVLADCVASLREWKQIGDESGVVFALEVHTNAPIETLADARKFCDAFPEMPLAYDPTHFVLQGRDTRESEWMLDKAVHVHVRDAAKGCLQTPFGEGDVDYDWILAALKDRGYAGHFSLEPLELDHESAGLADDVLRACDKIRQFFDVE